MELSTTQSVRLTTTEFVKQCRDTVIPLAGSLGYFSLLPLDETECTRLIHDPTSAFPPKLLKIVPNLRLILVPYLVTHTDDSGRATPDGSVFIEFQPEPEAARQYGTFEEHDGETYLFLAIRDEGLFDAHVLLYQKLASRVIASAGEEFSEPFYTLVNEELQQNVRGEVQETAWKLKQELLSYQGDADGKSRLLARYHQQALEDTLTLYMHGLCCDIDLNAGPKQLPSKVIRARLLLLKSHLPPPEGIALFPEELSAD